MGLLPVGVLKGNRPDFFNGSNSATSSSHFPKGKSSSNETDMLIFLFLEPIGTFSFFNLLDLFTATSLYCFPKIFGAPLFLAVSYLTGALLASLTDKLVVWIVGLTVSRLEDRLVLGDALGLS